MCGCAHNSAVEEERVAWFQLDRDLPRNVGLLLAQDVVVQRVVVVRQLHVM